MSRTYVPELSYKNPPLPAVPVEISWIALRNLLQKLKDYLEGVERTGPIFGLVFQAEVLSGGIRLTWPGSRLGPQRALAYNVYKSHTRSFQDARIIYTAHRGNVSDLFGFFDRDTSGNSGGVYYWIEAFNDSRVTGPVQGPIMVLDNPGGVFVACSDPRTYIPSYKSVNAKLPSVPTDPKDWAGIRRFLQAVWELLSGGRQNTTRPGLVPRFQVAQKSGGNLLTWDHEAVSAYYIIYRGLTNALNTARTVGVISEGSGVNSSFFDACGQEDGSTPVFYWIEPFTGFGQSGPLSIVSTTTVDCCGDSGLRPLTYARWDEHEAPSEVNGARSRVVDESLGTDVDAEIGLSATRVDMQIDSTNGVTPNYAQWFAYNFPEPDSGRTLVSATVWARAEFDSGSAVPGDLQSDICVFNTLTHGWPSAGVGTIHSFAMADTPVANYSRTWTAAQFATDFSSLASNVYVRAQQYAAVGNSFSPEVHMYIYDVWIQYLYA